MLKIYAEKNGKDFCIKKYTKPLQLMESLKEEFQIFFLDIEMPAMDGMELVDIIRRHDEKSIILYVSSHNEFLGGWILSMMSKILLQNQLHKYRLIVK